MVDSIRIVSLNCWGLKYLSDLRRERLSYIGYLLANATKSPEIVGLQECWTQEDFKTIKHHVRHILPYCKFYNSGVFGGGLAIFSKWPIIESTMQRYTLNGRPTAFFRGDWYVGKGIACATIRLDTSELLEVFCTHLHAPYEKEPNDSYLCHRTSQAWEMAKLLRSARAKGRLAISLGDFNMIPSSLAYQLITTHGPAVDSWLELHPHSSVGSTLDLPEIARQMPMPSAQFNLTENGATCDSILNTWRWTKDQSRRLKRGEDIEIDVNDDDPRAKRLDYVFLGGKVEDWNVIEANVGFVERHPDLRVTPSDHFSVEVTIQRREAVNAKKLKVVDNDYLSLELYDSILDLTDGYVRREKNQRRLRIGHFWFGLGTTVATLIAVWWSPKNYISFMLILLSSLGLMAGTVNGLIGFIFMSWELRTLKEFQWEMENVKNLSMTDDTCNQSFKK